MVSELLRRDDGRVHLKVTFTQKSLFHLLLIVQEWHLPRIISIAWLDIRIGFEELDCEVIAEQGGTWDLRVQLCTDLEKMPIEDPTVVWDERHSPFVTVATFHVDPQIAWTHGTSEAQEDRLSFNPWHGLVAHRPLGAINRARREVYDFSADYRADVNQCPVHAVRTLGDLDV